MGRRALPKTDPTVDLSKHLFNLDELDEPFEPQALFVEPAPLELEIGSGKGHFMLTQSSENPDRNYLGIELAQKYARFAAFRLAKHQRSNARMISGDGLQLFRDRLPDACAVGIHVYFPDPWWKERHRRRRIMQPEFIVNVERILKPNGTLHFWTDVGQYYDETVELIKSCTGLQGPIPVDSKVAEHDMDYRTHFERRMRLHEHDVYRAEFNKL